MFEQFAAVGVVLAALFAALYFLKQKGYARISSRGPRDDGSPRLEVIDRLSLTPHHSLHLVRLADRTLLVGISPSGCNLLECATGPVLPRGIER
jgi:flagellar biosynthetic protein FliO